MASTTIGIVPTRPETGYGYIEVGRAVAEGVHAGHAVRREADARARRGASSPAGSYLWNGGMFFFRASVMKAAIAEHLPGPRGGPRRIDEAAARGDEARVLAEVFPTLPSISIDHGVMEKAKRIAVVPGRLRLERRRKLASRRGRCPTRTRRATRCRREPSRSTRRDNLVRDLTDAAPHAKRWALVGVSDLVVVETDDAVLIVPRERAQDVRAVVDALAKRGETDKV